MKRILSSLDRAIVSADVLLKAFAGGTPAPGRESPADTVQPTKDVTLDEKQQQHAAGLMRVNHSGEVCAQALYRGQALTASSADVREAMQQSARDEEDHLAWCEQRLHDLDSHTSYLNPVWYGLSFSMGALTGLIGDRLSLGFVAATEEQVCKHLNEHMESLPEGDDKSRAVIEQMLLDEERHAQEALDEGGLAFPGVVKQAMTLTSRAMTRSSYRI